tara:strand:+ start:44047 stop:45789 length:1743 start_codon:yes stop_codon:yes gene_type:complete
MVGVILSQCDNASSYACQLNPACEWISESTEGLCSELNQQECQSGQYNYCYWQGWGEQAQCTGGNYISKKEYCIDANNAINEFVDNVAIRGLSTLLKSAGFREVYKDNKTKFMLDDGRDRFIISYDDIRISPNGFEVDNLEFYVGYYPNKEYDYKADKSLLVSLGIIKMDLSLDQLLYLVEQIIYDENLGKVSSFNINSKDMKLEFYQHPKYTDPMRRPEDYLEADEYSQVAYSLGEASFTFDGYLNQKILEDINRNGVLPNINQSLKFFIRNFSVDKLIGYDGEDLSDNFNFDNFVELPTEDLLKIKYWNIEAEYLPKNNKIQLLFDIDHPFLGFTASLGSDVFIDTYNPEDSRWNSAFSEFEVRYQYPQLIDLNMNRLIDYLGEEPVFLTGLPNSGNLQANVKFENLQSSIDLLKDSKEEEAFLNLLSNSELTVNGQINNIGLSIVDQMTWNKGIGIDNDSYTDFNIDNLSITGSVKKNNVSLKSNLNTNLFKADLNGDIDLYDPDNPWINKFDLNIYNINDFIMNWIKQIEKEERFKLDSNGYNNDINISVYGNSKSPQIRGIGPATRDDMRRLIPK